MTKYSVSYLKSHSGLPGPRGNLRLLYEFLSSCDDLIVVECLATLADNTENSPEEFVGMCGVAGYAILNWKNEELLVSHLRRYSRHRSWRIREAVAIAIQEIPVASLEDRVHLTKRMTIDDPFVYRAIVAGLCEPKNLKDVNEIGGVFDCLEKATRFLDHESKLSEGEMSLKKALGYCWSVAVALSPEVGKRKFHELLTNTNRNVQWIAGENLKKARLKRMDTEWVKACQERFGVGRREVV
jgi:hypothetical protein